jgi:hypothetical protein
MNSSREVKTPWTLKLTPRQDAWDIEPVTDSHNAWRNDPTKIVRKALPASFKATVPGCIHTDLIDAGFIDDISINGKEQDQFWIWKTDSVYTTTILQDTSGGHKDLIFKGLDTVATISINGQVRMTTILLRAIFSLRLPSKLLLQMPRNMLQSWDFSRDLMTCHITIKERWRVVMAGIGVPSLFPLVSGNLLNFIHGKLPLLITWP